MKYQKIAAKLLALCALVLSVATVAHATTYTYAQDVRWDNGLYANPSSVLNNRYNQNSALGAPNANTANNTGFLSLGIGGLAVFDFGTEFTSAAIVFETTGGRASYPLETARVYVADSSFAATFAGLNPGNGLASITTNGFTLVGSVTNKAASSVVDLSAFHGPFRYLLLQDITSTMGSSYDGFDVDAVGVSPVPEPGTLLLLGFGLAGAAVFSKRRRNNNI
jgi:hypothetical protein